MVGTLALAGCNDPDPSVREQNPAAQEPSELPDPTVPTGSAQNSPKAGTQQVLRAQPVFQGVLKYAVSGNDRPSTFEVTIAPSSLRATLYLNVSATGAYFVMGPDATSGGGVQIVSPSGGLAFLEYSFNYEGVSTQGSQVLEGPIHASPKPPETGEWKVSLTGTGHNTQASLEIVAEYEEDPRP